VTLREVDRHQRLPIGLPEVIAMLKYISTGFILSFAAMGTACGSSDDDGGALSATTGSGATGSGATGTGGSGSPVDLGGTSNSGGSGGSSGDSTRDGGLVDLTPEEVGSLGDASCAGWAAEPEGGDPAVLEFVVDTSLSMSLAPGQDSGGGFGQPGGGPGGGQGGPTKWQITRDALVEAIGELPDTMPVGLFFYPNRANENSETPLPLESCVNTEEGIAVDVLSEQHRADLDQALGAAEPNGWTPTHGAYRHALRTSLVPADFPGQKFMVLITDGLPTLTLECMGDVDNGGGFGGGGMPQPVDSQPIVDEISLAREEGVRTFLIGSPGSEGGREWMSEAAILGATAAAGCRVDGEPYCHMDMTTAPDFGAALRAGLRQIRQTVLSCTYDFPEPPDGQVINADLINLIVTTGSGQSQLVKPDENGECTEGWQVVGEKIVLCADTCDRIQNDPGSRLNLLFGCESGVVPPVK
jgi:hypothetical protein